MHINFDTLSKCSIGPNRETEAFRDEGRSSLSIEILDPSLIKIRRIQYKTRPSVVNRVFYSMESNTLQRGT